MSAGQNKTRKNKNGLMLLTSSWQGKNITWVNIYNRIEFVLLQREKGIEFTVKEKKVNMISESKCDQTVRL